MRALDALPAASRVVVHQQVYKEFLDRFVERARALRVGDGLDPRTQMGPAVSRGQLETVQRYVEIGRREGATLACGGRVLTEGTLARGCFHEPTVFADVDASMRIAQEEIFGPVVSVIPCKSLDEAVATGNNVQYGLSASIYTQDVNRAFSAMRDLYTGIFYVNAPTIGAEVHLPFGGTKATGNGHREAGTAALDVFSEWKSVYVDFSGRLQRAQIDTAAPASAQESAIARPIPRLPPVTTARLPDRSIFMAPRPPCHARIEIASLRSQ